MMRQEVLDLARFIDPERAALLERELSGVRDGGLGVLLGAAYPALATPGGRLQTGLELLAEQGVGAERLRGDLRSALHTEAATPEQPLAWLSELRRRVRWEKARIALREVLPTKLGGASLHVTAGELSDLADIVFEAVLAEAESHVAGRYGPSLHPDGTPHALTAFAMGKLGGSELNAGSDVDVIFFYDSDDGAGDLTPHDHFTRVVRRAVAHLEDPGSEGALFRIDLRLRPEGSQGALVNSLTAAERYYETWGRTWERVALLRARPMAGSMTLGGVLVRELIEPFVYRRDVDPSIAETVTEMLLRSRAELSPDPARDLKLGPGGIREAEFFVQTLQLVWGGRESSLRVRGTLPALERLRLRGYVTDREARQVARAYAMLRRAEHAIQWASGVQTHLLPRGEAELARLARTLGFDETDTFLVELDRVRAQVSEAFASLAPNALRELPRYPTIVPLLWGDPRLSAATEEAFQSSEIADHLQALARRPDGLLGEATRQRYPKLADQVLDALSGSPDPEQAARYLRSFFARVSASDAYVSALAEHPSVLGRMATVLGSSQFVGEAIATRPELADVIIFGEGLVSDVRAAVELEVEEAVETARALDAEERRQAFVGALRQVKRRVMVEVAIADLAGTLSTREVTRTLSELAETILRRVMQYELGDARGLCVLGLGKLGGQELGYASDLDVVFVYDPAVAPSEEEAPAFFAKQAQRVIRLLSDPHRLGPGYELDVRLRPSGSHGLLVTSLPAFARYHSVTVPGIDVDARAPAVLSSGAPWERQVLIRARFCAGDPAVGARALAVARQAAFGGGAPPVEEMHRLRLRMQRELGREDAGRYDLKVGLGGLLDVEFLVQWLQMHHGTDALLHTGNVRDALEALSRRGYLGRRDYETLRDAYRFLRRLEQRMHVQSGTSGSTLHRDSPALEELGRRMGYQDSATESAAEQLLDRYRAVTRAVRASYLRVLGLPAEKP